MGDYPWATYSVGFSVETARVRTDWKAAVRKGEYSWANWLWWTLTGVETDHARFLSRMRAYRIDTYLRKPFVIE